MEKHSGNERRQLFIEANRLLLLHESGGSLSNRIASIPVSGGLGDEPEGFTLRTADLGKLHDGSRMELVQEVDETPIRAMDPAFLPDLVACGGEAFHVGVESFCPVGHVLESLVPGPEEIEIHGWGVIELLDQLNLQVPRIGQRDMLISIGDGFPRYLKFGIFLRSE